MRNVAVAYRSLHPERTAPAVAAADKARSAAIDAMNAFTDTLFPKGQWVTTASFHFDGSIYPTGFSRLNDPTPRDGLPVGMRYDSKLRNVAPAKRTEEGKALVASLDALAFSYPLIDGLGGIVHASDGDDGYFTGWSFHTFGDSVYATLSQPIIKEKGQEDALAANWALAPLSEFHAARELAVA